MILSLVIQVLVDGARLPSVLDWTARLAAPGAAIATSGGVFGLAFVPAFRGLLYLGGLSLAVSVVLTGVGLLRARRDAESA